MCVNYKTKINYYQTGHLLRQGNKTGLDINPNLKIFLNPKPLSKTIRAH